MLCRTVFAVGLLLTSLPQVVSAASQEGEQAFVVKLGIEKGQFLLFETQPAVAVLSGRDNLYGTFNVVISSDQGTVLEEYRVQDPRIAYPLENILTGETFPVEIPELLEFDLLVPGKGGARYVAVQDGEGKTQITVDLDTGESLPMPGDLDGDNDVDKDDLNILRASFGQPASNSDDPLDLDGDGRITVLDFRRIVSLCTRTQCSTG